MWGGLDGVRRRTPQTNNDHATVGVARGRAILQSQKYHLGKMDAIPLWR